MTLMDELVKQLHRDEGLRLKPYRDSVGKLTIGYGRNLDDVGITPEEADYLLEGDIQHAQWTLKQNLPWAEGLDDARLGVLTNMAFNMGMAGLLQFRKMLAACESGDYATAAREMESSAWSTQVGARAHRLSLQMSSGIWQYKPGHF